MLSGITLATVGTFGLTNITPETLQKSNVSSTVQAYNHNPNNILDNVFEKDGQTILPFIFKDSDQTITKKYVEEQFKKAGVAIQNLSSLKDIIATGNQIKTDTTTYTVWIYGDVNSDGYVDSFDALEIVENVIQGKEPKGVYEIVGNVENSDNIVDSFDALRIVEFVIGTQTKLLVKEPLSTIEQNIECPKITLKGDDPQIIRLEDPYVELGATVTDNKDTGLQATIDSSQVDTKKMGTYYVTYKAVDSDGNERVVRREVKVVDYATDLAITKQPTKVEYRYGDELDLTDMVVTAKMKSTGDTPITVAADQYEVKGFDGTKVGKQTITISYAGKETTFEIEVFDYQTGIEVVFPKIEYLYEEELDLTGATVRTVMASGAKGEIEPITEDMIWGYNKEQTTKQTLVITYENMTQEVEVEVKDYAKSIQIAEWPEKQNHQKYGQELDLTGMVVNVSMAKAGNKTLAPTDYEISGYNKDKLGAQTIIISYAGKETDLPIIVENYVTGIRIQVSASAKVNYVEGDKIDFDGVVIKRVMAVVEEGKDTTISALDPKLMIVPNPNNGITFGTDKINIIYTTDNTIDGELREFEEAYNISVLRHLSSIRVQQENTEGYAHEIFTFGNVLSGESQEALLANQVKAYITDAEGNDVTNQVTMKVTDMGTEQGNQVKLTFEQKGDYHITFYVGSDFEQSTIKSPEQTIHIDYNPIITNVQITNLNETISVRKEKFIEKEITFTNKHNDVLTQVPANSIDFSR